MVKLDFHRMFAELMAETSRACGSMNFRENNDAENFEVNRRILESNRQILDRNFAMCLQ